MMSIRPRRSVLYMPATNARAMEKAKTLKADVIIFDMEDSVGPDAKDEARNAACDAVISGGYGMREVVIRVNDIESEWGRDDIAAAAVSGADAILVPKIYHPDDVKEIVKIMKAAGAPDDMPLWLMMETPAAILRADAIVGAHENIECLVVGSNDLVSELQAQHSSDRLAILTALSMTVVAARTNGLMVLDSVYNDFSDDAGFKAECEQGRILGFDGKTLIHPSQIDAANVAFAPDDDALSLAERQIEVFETAKAKGEAVAVLDGNMVEGLHVSEAYRLLALKEVIKVLEA